MAHLAFTTRRSTTNRFGASSGFACFYTAVVVIQGIHVFEHMVQLLQVYAFGVPDDDALGCPCPGIGDAALGVSDTQLHFVYNIAAYAATLVPFRLMRATRSTAPVRVG